MMAKIALFGATGYLGGHAVTRLVADGHKVRAIVRSPEKAELPAEVEVVQGDVTEPSTLPAALKGIDGVLIALNGGHHPERAAQVEELGVAHIASAASAAGVSRIVLLTGMYAQPAFADYPWERSKERGERSLLDGPVPATIFRIGFINETLAKFVRGGRPVIIGRQPHPIRLIAADDIMSAASRAFTIPETGNRVYDVAGEHPMLLREAAAAYASALTGKPFNPDQVRRMPLWFMRTINKLFLKGAMTRELGILASMNRYGDVTDTADWFRDFGVPQTSFEQWIAEQAQ